MAGTRLFDTFRGPKWRSTLPTIFGIPFIYFVDKVVLDISYSSLIVLGVCLLIGSIEFTLAMTGVSTLALVYFAWNPYDSFLFHLPIQSLYLALSALTTFAMMFRFPLVKKTQTPHPFAWLFPLLFLGSVIGLLLRDTSYVNTASWCILLLCLTLAAKSTTYFRNLKWPVFFANSALIFISIVIALALLEGGTRLFIKASPPTLNMFRWHPKYMYLTNPGSETVYNVAMCDKPTRPVHHKISAQGLRDRLYDKKEINEFRILMLGDSFTQGHAVTLENTIPKLLEKLFVQEKFSKKITVINGGFCAAGPLQELGMLCEYGLKLEPDLVILQLFPANDIENSLTVCNKYLRAYDESLQNFLQYLQWSDTYPVKLDFWFRQHCHFYRFITAQKGYRNLVVKMLCQFRFAPPIEPKRLLPSEERKFSIEADLRDWYPELQEGMDIMKGDILKIRAVCQEKKIGFTTYCIPKQEDIYDWLWQSETKPEPHTDLQSLYDRSKALRLTQAFLDEQKLTSFSVVDMLKTHLNEEPLYFFCDGHCSEYGNRLIAEQIHDYLIQTHFLGIFTAPRPMN